MEGWALTHHRGDGRRFRAAGYSHCTLHNADRSRNRSKAHPLTAVARLRQRPLHTSGRADGTVNRDPSKLATAQGEAARRRKVAARHVWPSGASAPSAAKFACRKAGAAEASS